MNACLLLDAAEVGAVMGKPFQLLGGGPTGPGGIAPLPLIPSQPDRASVWGSSCAFAAEVPPSNGRSSLVEVTTQLLLTATWGKPEHVRPETGVRVQPVARLGDEAVLSVVGRLRVLLLRQGTYVVSIALSDPSSTDDQVIVLAQTASRRLPSEPAHIVRAPTSVDACALLSPGDVAAASGRQGIQAMPLYSPWGAGSSRCQYGASRGDPFVTVTVVSSVNLQGWAILARDLAPGSAVVGLADQAFLVGDVLVLRKDSSAMQIAIQGFTGTPDQRRAFAIALAQQAIDRLP